MSGDGEANHFYARALRSIGVVTNTGLWFWRRNLISETNLVSVPLKILFPFLPMYRKVFCFGLRMEGWDKECSNLTHC